MQKRGLRLERFSILIGLIGAFALATSAIQAQRIVNRVSITGSSTMGSAIVIDFVKPGQIPPNCTQTYTPAAGERGDAVRDGLIPPRGVSCDFDSSSATCYGFLHRDSRIPTEFVASAPCVFECWIKNGSNWERIDGQTIDGMTFYVANASTPAGVGRVTFGPINLEVATGATTSKAVAELGGIAFVGSTGTPHKLTAIDLSNGSVLNVAQQPVRQDSTDGFRDGTSDGQAIMFSYRGGIEIIDPASALAGPGRVYYSGNVVTDNGVRFIVSPIPANGRRIYGLAYNPSGDNGDGSFWAGGLLGDLWELDLDGNVLRYYSLPGHTFQGLAWDHQNGTLWYNGERSRGALVELDPNTGLQTGRTVERCPGPIWQEGLAWVPGGLDGRNCGGDLLAIDREVMPDTLTGYRLQLWDTLSYHDERSLLIGANGRGVMPGDRIVRIGRDASLELDLSGSAGATWSAWMNFDPVAPVARPIPSQLSALFPSLWELAVDVSAGSLINVTPLSSGTPISFPISGLGPGTISLQAVSLNQRVSDFGNPCGLWLPIEVSGPNSIRIDPQPGCGVLASANGKDSFNADTLSGFFSVLNQTGQEITALKIDARPIANNLRFDTDQFNMENRFDAGVSTASRCLNTYRNGSDTVTGLVYAGTRLSPACSVTETGWIGTRGAAANSNDFQVLDFAFTDFGAGKTFEFDVDTDAGVGVDGGSMAGMIFTVTLEDGTVCGGTLVADPVDPNLSSVAF